MVVGLTSAMVYKKKRFPLHLLLAMIVSGCAAMSQDPKTVLIREPGNRRYDPPVDLSSSAKELWEYAVLSENVYIDGWSDPRPPAAQQRSDQERLAAYSDVCPVDGRLPLNHWEIWDDFPSAGLRAEARQVGLYMEVWGKSATPPMVGAMSTRPMSGST